MLRGPEASRRSRRLADRPKGSPDLMLTADVRFEGWTTEDWLRFLGLWQPRAPRDREPTHPRGGVIVVHEDGQILKLLHTRHGRLDPAPAPVDETAQRALELRSGQPAILAALARAHHASWALGLRLGALDEVMERFGARAQRGDDLTAQALQLVTIAREMIGEGAIAAWPQRLRGVPIPTANVVRRSLDAVCPDGRAAALGLFDAEGLYTAFVLRRRDGAFDVIAGPDELRTALGLLLSGDWRRDYRHLVQAVEVTAYAPLAFGCFAEVERFRKLCRPTRAPARGRGGRARRRPHADALAVGVGIGVDGARLRC